MDERNQEDHIQGNQIKLRALSGDFCHYRAGGGLFRRPESGEGGYGGFGHGLPGQAWVL